MKPKLPRGWIEFKVTTTIFIRCSKKNVEWAKQEIEDAFSEPFQTCGDWSVGKIRVKEVQQHG